MSYKLKEQLSTLPDVWAEPILRQVTPTSVSVWFAVQYKGNVTVAV